MKLLIPAALLCLQSLCANAQTGIPVPEMVQSDNIIKNFLSNHNIPGATVAIAKDGKIVYMRAFGYADVNQTKFTQPYNLFRIASLSKQITSVTIMKLFEEGKLTMSSKVFGPSGILKNHPVFSTANITDARIYDITIQNLMEHAAGWNRDLNCNPNPTYPYPYYLGGCDPISFPLRVTYLTGTSNPVSKEALIKFELEKGLDFTPGTSYNYSNMGYLILGEVIETLTSLPYETYVKDSVLAPLGIYDMHLGKNLKVNKQEREGEYVGNGYVTLSAYGDGTYVPWEYGGFSVEAMDAHGGWIASSRDMLKLLTAVDGFTTKPDILKPATITLMTTPSANNAYYAKGWSVNPYNNWWHTGGLDGTASEQVRTAGGYTWIIILNKRDIINSSFSSDLDNLGWNCLAATSTWPTWDLMASPTVNASGISFSNISTQSVTVNWNKGNGDKRLLLVKPDTTIDAFPLDGTDYTANSQFASGDVVGTNNYIVYNGTGNSVTVTGLTPGKKYYFRVVEYNNNSVTGNNSLYLLGSNPQATQTTAATLPIQLSYFTATRSHNNKVLLNWQTAQEINNDHFDVQRSSDGTNFTTVGNVHAKGNSTNATKYTFTDESPLVKNYYRLKQVDKDGRFSFSYIVLIELNSNSIRVAPNPASDLVYITGNNLLQASILDVSGKVLLAKQFNNTGDNSLNISRLAKGIYVVQITTKEGNSESRKLVIK